MTDITIDRLGLHGDGIAPGPIYAPRTLPGEVVTGEIRDGRIDAPRIVTPSPDRVRAPCRHYNGCGGCQVMHASDGFVAKWKAQIAREALNAHGLDTEWKPMAISPPRSRRRAVIAARRSKKGALAGFHARASDAITGIPDCHLLDPALLAALPMAEDLAEAGASRKAALAVTVTSSENGLDVSVTGGKPIDRDLTLSLAQIAQRHSLARLAWQGEVAIQRDPPYQRFGKARVVPPPGAFLQATREGEAALLASVENAIFPASRVVDLFAGCGTFGLALSDRAEIHGVEGSQTMTEAMERGWRETRGLKALTTEARDLFRHPLLTQELAHYDAAIIDPPRAGAQAQIAELARAGIPVIAHISCNPVTFARDAKTLTRAGYRLDWAQVVDQFRWSTHVELVACFSI